MQSLVILIAAHLAVTLARWEPTQTWKRRVRATGRALTHVAALGGIGWLLATAPVVEALVEKARTRLNPPKSTPPELNPAFVNQGIFQGQKMLVLDLKSCTRCDECTKACADTHGGNPRLLRDGLRFGDFLVATSCRSCHKPYCMDGCPVDAIHRKGTRLEVLIEQHCIGCGLCYAACNDGAHQAIGARRDDRGRTGVWIIEDKCVGCNLCSLVCPVPDCISMKQIDVRGETLNWSEYQRDPAAHPQVRSNRHD